MKFSIRTWIWNRPKIKLFDFESIFFEESLKTHLCKFQLSSFYLAKDIQIPNIFQEIFNLKEQISVLKFSETKLKTPAVRIFQFL
jgi:hypothetical protein